MRREDEPRAEKPFWDLDEELGELELYERAGGPELYTVRLKAHTATAHYNAKQALYPLQHNGTKHEVSGKAYILVPDITLTVGLYSDQKPSGAIGEVTESQWQGMRHHDIANVRGLYYEQDRAIGLWEVDSFGKLDDLAHTRLWIRFENWLMSHFPDAQRIFTDDDEPGDDPLGNRVFLRSWGYEQVSRRIFVREVDS